ncbi:epoxide hydrolase N-terminal domain-containing protein [Pseudomonas sp. PB120]|uniref:epoxide hydrolase N-terminal domain-containing protein n=1 Tax=Pseudomonas sp. PB120 TaxID=2494700 RepID=UPI002115A600|nr:epoxide hydrolase N-terminal domain-containing protein [Pseudomonas sp. PB120]
MPIRPFTLAVTDAQLSDLRQRLRHANFADALSPDSWEDGTQSVFLRRCLDYWCNEFDWRSQERRINQLPQFMTEVDGQAIHFLHQRGKGGQTDSSGDHAWLAGFLPGNGTVAAAAH